MLTAERDTNSIGSTKEIVSKCGYASTVTDGNGAVVSMCVVVGGLLVVLELWAKHQYLTAMSEAIEQILTRFMRGRRSITHREEKFGAGGVDPLTLVSPAFGLEVI